MNIKIRKAVSADVKEYKKLLSFYCLDTEKAEENLPEFKVAVLDDKIVGCADLDIGDIVELRTIAVLPNYRNRGIGSMLVDAILSRACEITDTVYLRTASPAFFSKKGFRILKNEMKKVLWKDCAECDKFHICRQVAMKIGVNRKL